MKECSKAWESYEDVATYLLNQMAEEFGLKELQGKQTVVGKSSGTKWEIDAKGIAEDNEIFFIVECCRYTSSRLTQESTGGLAYRIIDTGASGGILVSPLGLQEGAQKVAAAENIHSVLLDENSTRSEYILKFSNKVRLGTTGSITPRGSLSVRVIRKDGTAKDYGEV